MNKQPNEEHGAPGNGPPTETGSRLRAATAFLAIGLMLTASMVAMPKAQAQPLLPDDILYSPQGGCSPITTCITCPTGPCLINYYPCGSGQTGYVVNGVRGCASLCPSGTYGARVNTVGYCTPFPAVTYCGTGYVGARVDGIGTCQPIPTVSTCTGPTYGARVNGQGACIAPPSVSVCTGPSYGARVNGQGACVPVSACTGPSYGAYVSGVGTCYTPGRTGPCPSGQVGYEVGGVNGCRTPPSGCGPGTVGVPPACTPLLVPNGQTTACAASSDIAEAANIDMSPARLANCFAGPGGGPNAGVGRCDVLGTACAAVAGIAVDGCVTVHVTAEGRMRGQFMMVFPIDGAAHVEGDITSCMSLSVVQALGVIQFVGGDMQNWAIAYSSGNAKLPQTQNCVVGPTQIGFCGPTGDQKLLPHQGCVMGMVVANTNVPVPVLGASYGLVGQANAGIHVQSDSCHASTRINTLLNPTDEASGDAQSPSGGSTGASVDGGPVPLEVVPPEVREVMLNTFRDAALNLTAGLEEQIAGPDASPTLKTMAALVVAGVEEAIGSATSNE